jgi:hypothetical protein
MKKQFTGFGSDVVQRIGHTPAAKALDSLTRYLRGRSGVHEVRGMEFASVYDLVCASRSAYNKVKKKTDPCLIKKWHEVRERAFKEAIVRMRMTAGNRLETDKGQVFIAKGNEGETPFIAVEDFPAYVELIKTYHPRVAKKLAEGWAKAVEDKTITTDNF